jgi:hypothetical protein
MRIDAASMVNLELLTVETGERHGSLLSALDVCRSDAGRRLLRGWLCRPLVDIAGIVRRQDAVQEILDRPDLLDPLFAAMRACPDLERCALTCSVICGPVLVAVVLRSCQTVLILSCICASATRAVRLCPLHHSFNATGNLRQIAP